MERVFVDDLSACTRVELEAWKKRSITTRAQGLVAAFLKEQI